MEARRRCGWLSEDERGEERVVWVSRHGNGRGERISTSECPVSVISGESRAALEEWAAVRRLGSAGELTAKPARTVDAWLTLDTERAALEEKNDGG